jgi:hypothetical protein
LKNLQKAKRKSKMDLGKDFYAYFEPVDKESLRKDLPFQISPMRDKISFLTNNSKETLVKKANIVIIGFPGSVVSSGIRKHLYSLGLSFPPGSIADLGNLREGRTTEDTRQGLVHIVSELGKRQKPMIILGGFPEDTADLYKAYSALENPVNICGIDSGIPLSTSEKFPDSHYLNKILLQKENKLFDYSHLAYQLYYTTPEIIELLDQLYFNHLRLGVIRTDIREAEPEFRNSDILSYSMSAIRASDAPGSAFPGPNGLYAEEACQLARYAGLSERLSCLSINGISPQVSDNQATLALAAQLAWHFLQGFFQRRKEYPFTDISTYKKFIVNVSQVGHDIHFYNSPKTGRWWVEVPYPSGKFERSLYIACSPSDYKSACDGEIPDRWWKNFQRLS